MKYLGLRRTCLMYLFDNGVRAVVVADGGRRT